ncbi:MULTISPECIES: hypothetical protein [Sphingobium]|uniref:hypothetical protein n=1 Tax=Sphingobium TaxID=165695 RepID=UPI000A6274AA|nr:MULTISPECIES: hypothetical protein [Sphingobium]RYL99391.1 hypothetical protein EWH10_05785 [Sphingobium fuliginis]WDA36787.1 hypothetical protein PO876_00790 [Sphingobium sp. YC-XJ3]
MLRTLALLGVAALAGRQLLKGGRPTWSTPVTGNRDSAAEHDGQTAAHRQRADAPGEVGHRPVDLEGPEHPDGSQRADEHYRPDIHATVAPEDKESLRPVTLKSARGPTDA